MVGTASRMLPVIAVLLPVIALVVGVAAAVSPAAAQGAAVVSEAQDVNGSPGLVAEIVQCKREGGVLSIRMRLRNTGDKSTGVLFRVKDDRFYITGASKKYLVLRDSEKTPLATSDDSTSIAKGASYVWYAKYPAPPAEVKKVTFYTPFTAPFEDIPIAD